jgi:colanic acid biosynthesis glycosyl transferase WcaI
MAKILFLSLVFRPDNVSTAQIMGDLSLELKSRGHEIQVLTTVPHYNEDLEASERQPLRSNWGGLFQESDYYGMKVMHIFIPQKGGNKFIRMLGWIGFHLGSLLVGFTMRYRADVILAPSPPLTIGVVAWLLGKVHRCPWVYNVQEIYPDIAINLGELKRPVLIRFFQRLEAFVYQEASALAVISDGMAERIRGKGVPASKIRLIPNFVDLNDYLPGPKVNPFSLKLGIEDKFVVLYAGNMGKPQGLEVLVEAAAMLVGEPQIRFVLIGNGSERLALEQRVTQLRLGNVIFLAQQPYGAMRDIHASASACFVSQAPRTASDGIPSKVFRILGSARGILASTSADSDLARIVQLAGAGLVVPPGDPAAIARVLREALEGTAEWVKMGFRGRAYAEAHFSRPMISGLYDQLLTEVAATGANHRRQ